MKNMFGMVFILAAIIIEAFLRMTNIDMTEMRLFIEYWHIHLIVLMLGFAAFGLFVSDDK